MYRIFVAITVVIYSLAAHADDKSDVICSFAPSQSKSVVALMNSAGGASAATAGIAKSLGLAVVTHSSGAMILTGSSGYIAGTLGAAAIGPIVVTVGAVIGSVAVTVELACAPKNHPEYADTVWKAADRFSEHVKGIRVIAIEQTSKRFEVVDIKVRDISKNVFEYFFR